MKIIDVEAIPLSMPSATFARALGAPTQLDYGLVIIRTDDGIEGLGEISTLWDGRGAVQCAFVEHCFKALLIGRDPMDINGCLRKLDTLIESAMPARAAV